MVFCTLLRVGGEISRPGPPPGRDISHGSPVFLKDFCDAWEPRVIGYGQDRSGALFWDYLGFSYGHIAWDFPCLVYCCINQGWAIVS